MIDDVQSLNTTFEDIPEENLFYTDHFVTKEQALRDQEITKLLQAYVKTYENKVTVTTSRQNIIFALCIGIVSVFSVIFAIALILIFSKVNPDSTTGVVSFATACITFISLIVGLLMIITKYFFPKNGEKYITQIVETIQKNDLKNKRENAKNTDEDVQL